MLKKNKLYFVSLIFVLLCCSCSDGEQGEYELITKIPIVTSPSPAEKSITKESEITKKVYSENPELTNGVVQEKITPTIYPTGTISSTPAPQKQDRLECRIVRKSEPPYDESYIVLYPIRHNRKYGVINQYGEVVVEPVYDQISSYREGLARVKVNGKYGFMNSAGELVIPADYSYAGDFSEGLADVKIGNGYGYIDKEGKLVIEPKYQIAQPFSEGLAAVKLSWEQENVTYITKEGETVFTIDCGNFGMFHDGLASVRLPHWDESTYGYMDKKGSVVILPFTTGSPDDASITAFSEGFGIMDWEKENGELAKVYVNTKGEILGNYVFDVADSFSEGLAYAERDGICGYIDFTGEYVLTGVDGGCFHEGLAAAVNDHRVGFIDKDGKFVIEPIYNIYHVGFSNGYAIVSQGEELICINKSGEEMWRLLPEE